MTAKSKKNGLNGAWIERIPGHRYSWEQWMIDLARRIVYQAVKDLCDDSPLERVTAALYFVEGRHVNNCKDASIDPVKIKESVLEIIKEDGIRRRKLVKDLLKQI